MPAQAAQGDLDPSFGTGGMVTTDFAVGFSDLADAVVLQQDGKIVAAGLAGVDFALARYNTDGSLDPSFGTGGKVTTDFAGFDQAFAIMLQPDGKLVAAGTTNQGSGNADFALARYNTDGSFDPSFGTGGKVTTDFAGRDDFAFDLVLQADGKIVVAGSMGFDIPPPFGLSFDFALARYNTNGSLDPSFGTGGKVATDFAGGSDGASAVLLQPDGKFVAAGGASDTAGFPDFALARYNTDGSLDPSFGTGAKVTTDFAGFFDEISELRLQEDGKLLAAGTAGSVSDFDFALVRYNPSGTLDPTFGTGGKVTTDFGGIDFGSALVMQSNGKLVAAGTASNDFALVRYNPDGTPDTGFGTAGKVTTDFAGGSDGAIALLLQPDGMLVAGGMTDDFALVRDFALTRYLGDPTPISVPFTAFLARLKIKLGTPEAHEDAFKLTSLIKLGANSDGIHPRRDNVFLQVGAFFTTIPAGSLRKKHESFLFKGRIDGVRLTAVIWPLGHQLFLFVIKAKSADLTGTVNPVPIALTIGNDSRSTSVVAEFE